MNVDELNMNNKITATNLTNLTDLTTLSDVRSELIDIYDNLKNDHSNFEEIQAKVRNVLERYKGSDWKEHVFVETSSYYKDLFYTSNEFDIVVITWAKGHRGPIHNHPDNGCNVKVLEGSITEERYNTQTFEELCTSTYYKNNVMYIDDNLGYHRMCNTGDTCCITLHIYAPGNYKPVYYILN